MKRPIVALLVLAAAAASAWYLWFRPSPESDGTLTLYGNIDIREVDLGFRVGGRLAAMRFEEGDRVASGDVMAELEPAPFEDDVRIAEAEVASQRAILKKVETGSRPEEIAQAQALVAERKAALDNAAANLERQRTLVEKGHASQQAHDDARARKMEAEARLKSAEEALELARAGSRQEDIASARANLQMAEARLGRARTAVSDTRLVAPNDGIVLNRIEEPGAIVAAGAPVYSLSLVDPVWVRTYVTEPDLGRVAPGMKVRVITDSAPDRPYEGQVGFVSPVAEFTPKTVETADLRTDLVYRLRVVVSDPDQGLRQGMPVTVVLDPGTGRE